MNDTACIKKGTTFQIFSTIFKNLLLWLLEMLLLLSKGWLSEWWLSETCLSERCLSGRRSTCFEGVLNQEWSLVTCRRENWCCLVLLMRRVKLWLLLLLMMTLMTYLWEREGIGERPAGTFFWKSNNNTMSNRIVATRRRVYTYTCFLCITVHFTSTVKPELNTTFK